MPQQEQVRRFVEVVYLGAIRHHFGTEDVLFEWLSPWESALDIGFISEFQVEVRDRAYVVHITRHGEHTLHVTHTETFESRLALDYPDYNGQGLVPEPY